VSPLTLAGTGVALAAIDAWRYAVYGCRLEVDDKADG
jgi:hypothetical protein